MMPTAIRMPLTPAAIAAPNLTVSANIASRDIHKVASDSKAFNIYLTVGLKQCAVFVIGKKDESIQSFISAAVDQLGSMLLKDLHDQIASAIVTALMTQD